MRRRDFVKSLVAASVSAPSLLGQQSSAAAQVAPSAPLPTPPGAGPELPPMPVPWMRGLMETRPLHLGAIVPDVFASPRPKFFTETQTDTLRQFCEIVMPPLKGYPGAMDAGAPEFLDYLISVSPPERQHMYRTGLDRLEHEARQKFGVPFAGVNAQQADALIRPFLRAWMQDHPPTEPHEAFINLAHADVRTATMNSRAWSEAELAAGHGPPGVGLYWYPVEADVEEKYLPRA